MKLSKRISYNIVCLLLLSFFLVSEMECSCSAAPSYVATLLGMKDADGYDRQDGWFHDGDFDNSLRLLTRQYPTSQINYISNCSAATGLEYLKKSCIFMLRSHGERRGVKFTDPNGAVTWITVNTVAELPDTAFINCQLVVYGTCSAGEGGRDAINIVNSTFDKYARHVVGFQDKIYRSQANDFFHQFMHELGAEKETLGDAYEDALFWVKVWNLGDAGGINNVLIRGNENHYLTGYKVFNNYK